MRTLVLDFGSESRDAVFRALRLIVGDRSTKVLVLPEAEELDMDYVEFLGALDAALEALGDRKLGSLQLEGRDGLSLLAGVYRPGFANEVLGDWSGSAELADEAARALFDELKNVEGLGYLALSKEESPEFETSHVDNETFPWSDWRLIAGAVRNGDGTWIVRSGSSAS